jgi:hypothetical protein
MYYAHSSYCVEMGNMKYDCNSDSPLTLLKIMNIPGQTWTTSS